MTDATVRGVEFRSGLRGVLAWAAGFAALALLWIPLGEALAGAPDGVRFASEVLKFGLLAGVTLAVLRYEGVRPAALGLSRRHLAAAVAAFGAVWVALNGLGVSLAVAFGNEWGVSLLWEPLPVVWGGLPAPRLLTVLLQFLVVGLVEELTVRGYLQTRLVALLGGRDRGRARVAAAVLLASLVFGLLHVPAAVVGGASVGALVGLVAFRTASGVFFGSLYEATHNVYLLALLHGLGNTWVLFVDVRSWSGLPLALAVLAIAGVYGAGALGYRYWVRTSPRAPPGPGTARNAAVADAADP